MLCLRKWRFFLTFPNQMFSSARVPDKPTWKETKKSESFKDGGVDAELVYHLERLSLVDFNNKAGIERLAEAVKFADKLLEVDTTGVEPMDSVLEDRNLFLRDDVVKEGNCRNEVMKNAVKTYEEYFVAPPGNIPLDKSESNYDDT